MKISTAVLSLVALIARVVEGSSKEAGSIANVPSFTVQELLLAQRDPELVSILTTTGLLTVSMDDNDDLSSSLQGLCDCPDFLTIDGTDTVVLDDGATVRSTLATATVGTTTPLPLGGVATACGGTLQQDLEQVRDHVATASSAFTVALDRILLASSSTSTAAPVLMRDAKYSQKVYPTVSSITASANHLEHFHIYEKGRKQSRSDDKTLDWHTDAGLFLSFVPGQECGSGVSTDGTFYFRNSHHQQVSAVFSPNSVAIMLGVGAQHWIMSSSLPLKATQHAVQMTEDSKRVWYGMSKFRMLLLVG